MKTYRGYPAEIHIDGKETTVHDVERLILSLYWDKEIPENDNDRLSTDYKRERQQWLDSQFVWSEENKQRLQEVAKMYEMAFKRLQTVAETIAKEQLSHGDEAAKSIVLHTEIDDQLGGQSDGITDEDAELWDALCNEDRDRDPYWGIYCFKIDLTDRKASFEDRIWWRKTPKDDKQLEPMEKRFSNLRERYFLAWQDIMRIPRFIMTVDVEY